MLICRQMACMGLKWRRKGTGQNLSELAPGRWKVSVNLPAGQNPDGKRHHRVAYVDDGKRAAEAKRRELLTARDQGKLKPRTAGTVVEYLERWLAEKRPTVAARTASRWKPTSVARSRPTGAASCCATCGATRYGNSTPRCKARA